MDLSLSLLSRIPLFASIDNEDLLKIQRTVDERSVRSRQMIFLSEQRSDHVFLLKSGRVKLTRGSSSGREITYALINPQEVFGETALFSTRTTYPYSCEALEDSSFICFQKSELEAVISVSADALTVLFQMQARRRLEAETRLSELIFFDVSARLARLLVNLSTDYGRSNKVGTVLRLKVTHQDLANLIGSTRETTTLILSEFRRQGLIDFAGRKIVVIDPDNLLLIEGASYLRKNGQASS